MIEKQQLIYACEFRKLIHKDSVLHSGMQYCSRSSRTECMQGTEYSWQV